MIEITHIVGIDLNQIYGQKFVEKWENSYNIFSDSEIQSWIQSMIIQFKEEGKDPKKFSITGYLKPIQDYCDYYHATPTELLKEELDSRNSRLRDYLSTLLSKGVNPTSVKNATQSRIKSFYSNRGSPITYGMKSEKAGVNENEIILNNELIEKIMQNLNSAEYRLLLKMQTMVGFRIDDLLNELTSGKYKILKYNDHYYIPNFRSQKEMVIINYVFLPTELERMIQSVMGIDDLTKLDLTTLFQNKKNERILQRNYLDRLKEVVNDVLKIEGNIKTHTFRKYFSSKIRALASQLDGQMEFAEHLMGHEGQNLSQAYNNNLKDINWYYGQWLKIESSLLIQSVVIDKTDEEVIALKEQQIKTETRFDLLMQEYVKMKDENDKLKQTLHELVPTILSLKEKVSNLESKQ